MQNIHLTSAEFWGFLSDVYVKTWERTNIRYLQMQEHCSLVEIIN